MGTFKDIRDIFWDIMINLKMLYEPDYGQNWNILGQSLLRRDIYLNNME